MVGKKITRGESRHHHRVNLRLSRHGPRYGGGERESQGTYPWLRFQHGAAFPYRQGLATLLSAAWRHHPVPSWGNSRTRRSWGWRLCRGTAVNTSDRENVW